MSREVRRALLADHARRRNGYAPGAPGAGAGKAGVREHTLRSPTCGDQVTVRLTVDGDRIAGVTWEGRGCEISTASASILADVLPGHRLGEVDGLVTSVAGIVHGPEEAADAGEAGLIGEGSADGDPGDVAALAGIGRYPLRAGCALLAWRAAALAAR